MSSLFISTTNLEISNFVVKALVFLKILIKKFISPSLPPLTARITFHNLNCWQQIPFLKDPTYEESFLHLLLSLHSKSFFTLASCPKKVIQQNSWLKIVLSYSLDQLTKKTSSSLNQTESTVLILCSHLHSHLSHSILTIIIIIIILIIIPLNDSQATPQQHHSLYCVCVNKERNTVQMVILMMMMNSIIESKSMNSTSSTASSQLPSSQQNTMMMKRRRREPIILDINNNNMATPSSTITNSCSFSIYHPSRSTNNSSSSCSTNNYSQFDIAATTTTCTCSSNNHHYHEGNNEHHAPMSEDEFIMLCEMKSFMDENCRKMLQEFLEMNEQELEREMKKLWDP